MWEYLDERWNGKAAAMMYKGSLLKAMKKAFPAHAAKKRAIWKAFEGNDPTGYKSGEAKIAKAKVGIVTNDLPKRSPDLNGLGISFLSFCLCVAQSRPGRGPVEARYEARSRPGGKIRMFCKIFEN